MGAGWSILASLVTDSYCGLVETGSRLAGHLASLDLTYWLTGLYILLLMIGNYQTVKEHN